MRYICTITIFTRRYIGTINSLERRNVGTISILAIRYIGTVSILARRYIGTIYSLDQRAGGSGLYMNADKTASMCLKKKDPFLLLVVRLVDQFTYLGSNISSTERESDVPIVAVWTAIDRLTTK